MASLPARSLAFCSGVRRPAHLPYLWWITNLLFWIIFLMHSEHWKQGHAGLLQVCPRPMMMSHQWRPQQLPGTDCRAAAAAPEPEREGVYALFAVTQDRGLHQISHWLAVTSQACGETPLANGQLPVSQASSTASGNDKYSCTLIWP